MLARFFIGFVSELEFYLESDGSWTFIWFRVGATVLSGARCNPTLAGFLSGSGSELDFYLESDASWTFIWLGVRAGLLSGI